jgi:hypothetical protein
MTELHAGLQLYRDQLRDAVERDLARRRRWRFRPRGLSLRLGLPAAAAAGVAATLAIAFTGGPPVQSADAAILRHVSAALSEPPGFLIHERAMVSLDGGAQHLFELWAQTDPPYTYRVIKWDHTGTGTGRRGSPENIPATLRSLVQSGQAAVDGTATVDGIPAYKLTVHGADDTWLNGTAYVAQSDYLPIEIDSHGEVIRYQAYERLPATAANLRLLELPARAQGANAHQA